MDHDVFVSYNSADRETALRASRALEQDGLRCWIAPRDVPPGTPWAAAIVEAIPASRVLLLVFSSRTRASDEVMRELTIAAGAKVPILPMRIEDVQPQGELAYYIRRTHWLDTFVGDLAQHLPALTTAVRGHVAAGRRATEAEPPAAPRRRRGPLASRRARLWLLAGVLAAGVGVAAFAWSRRSARIDVRTEPPGAEALVDDAPVGRTPLVHPVSPGPHRVALRFSGFQDDFVDIVDLGAGERFQLTRQLILTSARPDEAADRLLASTLGYRFQRFPHPASERAPEEGRPVQLLSPSGRVRPEDVSVLLLDVDRERIEEPGVVFLESGPDVRWSAPIDASRDVQEVEVPRDVLARLQPGRGATWGWRSARDAPVAATLTVESTTPSPSLDDVDQRLARQPAAVRAHARAQWLLDRGFLAGALREARVLWEPDHADLRAGAVLESALAGMGGRDTRFGFRLREALRSAPEAERARVFDALPDAR